jgi:hypothetical protein
MATGEISMLPHETKEQKRALKAFRKKMLQMDTRPSEGLWYFVWLKPMWQLMIFKATEYGELSHLDAWSKFVADKVAKHYKINPDDVVNGVDSLRNSYLCMPRGRVSLNPAGDWIFVHGDDFPICREKAMMLLPSRFSLMKQLLLKKVKFKFDEHEVMDKLDQRVAKALIGKIPYKYRALRKQVRGRA